MILMDDKYTFEDFGLIPEKGHENPMTPNIERKTLYIPGRAGQWDFGAKIKEKPLIFPLACLEINKFELERRLNAFVSFLYDEFGQPRDIKISYDYDPGKFYIAKVADSISPERILHLGRFVLPLVADDPYKYTESYADEVLWGSKTITFEAHYLLGHVNEFGGTVNITSPQILNIYNSGLAVQPVFKIKGKANNLKIECGKYSFTLPNFSNDKWIVDFGKYIVTKNGQEQILDGIDKFYLMPGNNAVKITGNSIDIKLRIKYRDKYN